MYISQWAISKQIKFLEERYKTGLFERQGNSILLTPAGRLLYQKLLVAKQLQPELDQEMQSVSEQYFPKVRMVIGSSTTIPKQNSLFPNAISFSTDYPPSLRATSLAITQATPMDSVSLLNQLSCSHCGRLHENCQPLVDTFSGKQANAQHYQGSPTLANGLAVPRPVGEAMMLRVLQASGGTAIGISEEEMLVGVAELSRQEGLFVAPEGAATWMTVRKLLRMGWLAAGERILLLNTGSGGKYLENLEGKYPAHRENNRFAGEVAGGITPF